MPLIQLTKSSHSLLRQTCHLVKKSEEFLVTITSKLTCKIPSLSAKGKKSRDNIIMMKRLEPETPIETGSPIHKDESILVTAN